MFKKLCSVTQYLRLPCVCVICSQYHHQNSTVCKACHALFTPITAACKHCALPLVNGVFDACGHCIKKKPYFDFTVASHLYQEPLRSLLHDFKYRGALYLQTFLSDLVISHLPTPQMATECLIPVPMHPKRLKERGFNHTVELTKSFSRALNIPYNTDLCYKKNHTPTQAGLSQKERQRNVRDAFTIQKTHYQHVTLIDDLITTGSTANALARALKKSGVTRIDVWCCARAAETTRH